MTKDKHLYLAEGSILDNFDREIGRVNTRSLAVSKAKAKANIIYNFKKDMGLEPYAKLIFVGTIAQID